MSFAFPKVEAETGIPITGRNASLTDYLGTQLVIGAQHTAGGAIRRWVDQLFDDSELLDPKRANELYSNPDTGLVFDEPIRENRAKAMQERHDLLAIAQAELDTIQNVGAVKGSAGFITQMIGGMTDPIDFAMNFIPFVGSAKLVKAGMGPMTRSVTRGLLISEETIAKHVTFPRITAAVIDATAGNLLAEIPVAIQARRNKEQYEVEDFAANILGGAVVGGAIKGFTLGIGRAREAYARVSPAIQDRMLRDSIQQMAAGKSPDVHSHASIDPKLMEAEWREREAAIRASFETGGTFQERFPVGEKVKYRPAGESEMFGKPLSEGVVVGYKKDPTTGDMFAEVETKGGLKDFVGDTNDITPAERASAAKVSDPEAEAIADRLAKVGDDTDMIAATLELPEGMAARVMRVVRERNNASIRELNAKAEPEPKDSPEYQAFVKERIDKYVAEQKKLFDVEYQKKLAVSEAARVKQDIGPLAKAEDIAKLDGTRVPEAAIADLAEDARALSADAEADLKALEVDDPELAAHIRKTLKEQMDVIDSPEPKAIEAAMRCLINE